MIVVWVVVSDGESGGDAKREEVEVWYRVLGREESHVRADGSSILRDVLILRWLLLLFWLLWLLRRVVVSQLQSQR